MRVTGKMDGIAWISQWRRVVELANNSKHTDPATTHDIYFVQFVFYSKGTPNF